MATEYISTETGCQYLRKYKIEAGTSFLYDEGFNDGIETAISCIGNEIPAADVRPVVRGKWEIDNSYAGPGLMNLRCSVCGEFGGTWRDCTLPSMLYKFCPNCGADMEGNENG